MKSFSSIISYMWFERIRSIHDTSTCVYTTRQSKAIILKKRWKRKICFSKPLDILEISGFSSLFSWTFWIQTTLQFLWMIWQLLGYLKDCIRLRLSSARRIVAIRYVKVELRGRKREKNKISFFQSQLRLSKLLTFRLFINVFWTFWLQVALENFLSMIWWRSGY